MTTRLGHHCAHPNCQAYASFGYGVKLRLGEMGLWYCAEHVPVDVVVDEPQAPQLFGRLL